MLMPAPARRHRDSGAARDVHRAVFLNICTLTPHSPDRLCAISDRAQSSLGRIEKPGIPVYVFDLTNRSKASNGLTAREREAHLEAPSAVGCKPLMLSQLVVDKIPGRNCRWNGVMLSAFSVFVLFVVLFALIFVVLAVQRVPQGNEWTVERFGRYVRTLEPGLALIVPVVDRIGAKMNMMETVLDVPSQSVITRDNAVVTVDDIVFYQVLDAAKAAYEVTTLEIAILNLVMTNIRTVMGSMSLDELLSERDRINSQLLTVVDAATTPWGVKVQRVEIKDITPPQELVAAMARQMKAEREKRANVLEAEGFKQAAVLKAEGEKQAVILAAEARREAAFRDAEARERQAEAEASATTSVSEAIGRGSIQAINYFVAQRYIDAIGRLAGSPNQKVILMPLESASMIGSLAGIAEVARETFGAPRAVGNPAVAGPAESR